MAYQIKCACCEIKIVMLQVQILMIANVCLMKIFFFLLFSKLYSEMIHYSQIYKPYFHDNFSFTHLIGNIKIISNWCAQIYIYILNGWSFFASVSQLEMLPLAVTAVYKFIKSICIVIFVLVV